VDLECGCDVVVGKFFNDTELDRSPLGHRERRHRGVQLSAERNVRLGGCNRGADMLFDLQGATCPVLDAGATVIAANQVLRDPVQPGDGLAVRMAPEPSGGNDCLRERLGDEVERNVVRYLPQDETVQPWRVKPVQGLERSGIACGSSEKSGVHVN